MPALISINTNLVTLVTKRIQVLRSWKTCRPKCKASWTSFKRCSTWAHNWFKQNVSSCNLSTSTTSWLKELRMKKWSTSKHRSRSRSPWKCICSWSSFSKSSTKMWSRCNQGAVLVQKSKQTSTCSRRRCLTSHWAGLCKHRRAMRECHRWAIQDSLTTNRRRTWIKAEEGCRPQRNSTRETANQPMSHVIAPKLRTIMLQIQTVMLELSLTTNGSLRSINNAETSFRTKDANKIIMCTMKTAILCCNSSPRNNSLTRSISNKNKWSIGTRTHGKNSKWLQSRPTRALDWKTLWWRKKMSQGTTGLIRDVHHGMSSQQTGMPAKMPTTWSWLQSWVELRIQLVNYQNSQRQMTLKKHY